VSEGPSEPGSQEVDQHRPLCSLLRADMFIPLHLVTQPTCNQARMPSGSTALSNPNQGCLLLLKAIQSALRSYPYTIITTGSRRLLLRQQQPTPPHPMAPPCLQR
jgi:hypothetical protein